MELIAAGDLKQSGQAQKLLKTIGWQGGRRKGGTRRRGWFQGEKEWVEKWRKREGINC